MTIRTTNRLKKRSSAGPMTLLMRHKVEQAHARARRGSAAGAEEGHGSDDDYEDIDDDGEIEESDMMDTEADDSRGRGRVRTVSSGD